MAGRTHGCCGCRIVWPVACASAANSPGAGKWLKCIQSLKATPLLRTDDGADARFARITCYHAQGVRRPSKLLGSADPNIHHRTTAASYTVFFDAIAAQGRALSRTSLDQADTSLTPPQALLTHAQDLRAILALHTAEAEADQDGDGEGNGEMGGADDSATIERALDALVDPAVRMCVAAAGEKDAALRRQAALGPAWDRPVFVLNCLTYLVDTLAPYPCASRKRTELDSAVEARVLELIEEHVRFSLLPPIFSLSLLTFSSWGFL